MIPADLASRLRMLIDSDIKAPLPIRDLLADFPDLETGQRFTATIENALPDGTFRALVADRSITLSLPNGAKSGDVLDLVVTGSQDKTITAKLADTAGPATSAAQPKLSPAGQLISQLLTGRQGEPAATLNRNEPLLPAPPTQGSSLTPVLRQAVSESGLFYEAHQAQWAEGETSLESLMREPQAQAGMTLTQFAQTAPQVTSLLFAPATNGEQPAEADTSQQTAQTATSQPNQPPETQTAKDIDNLARAELQTDRDRGTDTPRNATADDSQARSSSGALKIAEQLMPIVHQQLETLATHQAMWQGQVWPGQTMQWQIFDPEGQSQSSDGSERNEPPPWQSTLRLRMPRLGDIEAQLIITAAGVAVRVSASSAQTATQLREGGEALANALEAAGVPMTGFAVQLEATDEAKP